MTARCAFVEATRGKWRKKKKSSPRNYGGGYVLCVCGYSRDAEDVNHLFKLRLEASGVECRKGRTNKNKGVHQTLNLAQWEHLSSKHSFRCGCKRLDVRNCGEEKHQTTLLICTNIAEQLSFSLSLHS